jgi:hypothetical protein
MLMSLHRQSVMSFALMAWIGAALPAHGVQAQGCMVDDDCGAGFACRFEKRIACSGGCGTGGSTGGAGVGGATGDAGAAGCGEMQEPVCQAETVGICEQATCTSDTDCLAGTLCTEQSVLRCSIEDPCPGIASCPVDPAQVETVCSEQEESVCTPRNALPCASDADCGEGFECLPGGEVCTCDGGGYAGSGGATAAGGSGGVGGTMPDPGGQGGAAGACSCTPSTYCELRVLPCTAAIDCPSVFDCEPNPCSGCGGGMAGAGGTAGAAGSSDVDAGAPGTGGAQPFAGAGGCEPDPSAPAFVCRPPDYLGYYGCPGGGAGAGGSGGSGEAGGGPSAGMGAAGSGDPGSAGTGGSGSGSGGSGGGSSGDDDESHHHHPFPGAIPRFDCSAASTNAADALSAFAMVALCVAHLRRRSRRA